MQKGSYLMAYNILIAEDETDISNLLYKILTSAGFCPRQAFSGTEAKLLLELEQPDLILLDLMLPGLSGEELLREIRETMETVGRYSLYAHEEELRQGFITVAGGHRVGVAGQAVLETDGRVRTFKNISYLNIRVSHQMKGAADKILPVMYREGGLRSALIISPPGCGKTTLLRDLIRQISDGNAYGPGMTVGVVDERSELAGSFQGKAQNDMGMRTDVLDGCPKEIGMLLLLRAMSPQVIAIDELGSEGELKALGQAAACGCRILATVHGEDRRDVERRFGLEAAFWERLFEVFFVLGKHFSALTCTDCT